MSHPPMGMYQPGSSVIHRLHPGVKILALLILLVAVIETDSLLGYGVLLLFMAVCTALSGLAVKTVFAPVRQLLCFFLLIFLMNTCFYAPENAWFRLWIFQPSKEGMLQGIHVVARVFFMLVFSNLLTVTTAPLAMTGAFEGLLFPLRLIGVPVGQIAMILSVAIQFIPILFEETEMIRKAQMARGARFDSPRLFDKAKAALPLVIPIFLAAFKRADELSLAMEARGYRADLKPVKRRMERLSLTDGCALGVCIALCALQFKI